MQWNRQRESQLRVMVTENIHILEERVIQLVRLEERHQESELSACVLYPEAG